MNGPVVLPARTATHRAPGRVAPVLFTALAVVQGLYYLATGVWPLVSMDTFLMVTGPKTDLWLVETVGILVGVIGAALLLAAWRRRATGEVALLAAGSAVGLTGIDVVHVLRGVIPPVYLADAAAEVLLLAGWAAAGLMALRARPAAGEGS